MTNKEIAIKHSNNVINKHNELINAFENLDYDTLETYACPHEFGLKSEYYNDSKNNCSEVSCNTCWKKALQDNQEEIQIKDIQKLTIKPGETLIATTKEILSFEQRSNLYDTLKQIVPYGNNVLILPDQIKLSVLSGGKDSNE